MALIKCKKTENKIGDSLSWIWQNSRGQRVSVLILAIVDVMIALCTVYDALALRNIVNNAVAGDKRAFIESAWIMIGMAGTAIILRILNHWLDERTRAKLENHLKGRLFETLLTKDYSSISAVHSGEWLNRMTSDSVIVANNAVDIVPNALATFVRLILSVTLVLFIIKDVSWIVFPCIAVLICVTILLRKQMKKLHRRIQEADGRLRTFISDCLSSLMVIRSFSRENDSESMAEGYMTEHMERRMDRVRFSNIVNTGYLFILEGVYIAAVIYCANSILTGVMNYGSFIAVITLVGKVQGPITTMSSYVPRWYAMQASAERLMEAEHFTEDYANGRHSKEDVLSLYNDSFEGLSLRNISFTYRQTDEKEENFKRSIVISDVNLEVDKHDIFAITGPSGCGKSTLLKILMSFYPLDSGERLIRKKISTDADGSTGTEYVIPLDSSWRGLFAYVPQGNQLMSGSIHDILTFRDRNISDEDIATALDIACASDFVAELPEGLNTQLGERGGGLSEGQIQRLAIARAIISGQPILLLDEATSSLDEVTEANLIKKIQTLTDRTVILVTHRQKVLSICNKELKMDERIIEERTEAHL